jgi:NAD(P)-dependent dehydrogenase (short-subunit alcohol dehydrogenase family)
MPNILIVGASRGIGLGLVEEFARRGWSVTASVRDAAKADALKALVNAAGGRVSIAVVDIADRASAEALRGALADQEFDALVINAGVGGPPANPRNVEREVFADLLVTNALGPVRLAELLVKQVKPQTGVIGFVTSQLGSVGNNTSGGTELYRASKAALNSLTRSFAARHRDQGLSILSLHPGWVRTDMGGPNAAIDVATSAQGLADRVEQAVGAHREAFLDYSGAVIPW